MLLKRAYFWFVLLAATLFILLAAPFVIALFWLLRQNLHVVARRFIFCYGSLAMLLWRPVMPVRMLTPRLDPALGPCIIVANHQSFLDMYAFSAQGARNTVQVVQAWPFRKLFFFAPIMRLAEYIETGAPDNEALVARCRALLAGGTTIFCFPEGTRTRTGNLQRFYAGMFRVAVSCNATIVPMVFHDTIAVCPAGTFAARPQEIKISVLDPIRPDAVKGEEKPHLRLRDLAREAIAKALDEHAASEDRK